MSRMHVCCVPGCYNRRDRPGLRFFLVPTVETRREKWQRFIGEGVRVNHHTRVCSAHFTPDDYHSSGFLRRQAFPTIPASPSLARHESSFKGPSAVNLIGNGEPPSNSADECMEVVTNQEIEVSSVMNNVKQELCRVCGSKDDSLISIFENSSIENTHNFSLVKMLEMYLPLKIQYEDNLPSKICSKCSCMVNQWHEFYITCVAADKTFQSMFCRGNVEGDHGVPVTRLADKAVHFTICNESSMENPILKMKENVNENDDSKNGESGGNGSKNCDNSTDITSCMGTVSGEEKINCPEIRELVPLIACRYCCNLFHGRSSWRSHCQTCKESITICEKCGKIILRKNLTKHKLQHHSTKKLCDKCGRRYNSSVLSSHLLTHHSEIYYCDLCWKIFKTYKGHQKHIIRHQMGEIRTAYKMKTFRKEDKIVFVCPVCNLSFDDKPSLIIHLNKSKPRKCPVCKLMINNEKLYYRHQCKKFYCQYCFRSFYSKTCLMGHERTHTGEAPFKCNICNLSFKTACVRSAHRRTVHGDPTHKCTYCPKKYYVASHLRYHMDIHEGVRYPCPLCDKSLTRNDTLRKHIKLHKMGRI